MKLLFEESTYLLNSLTNLFSDETIKNLGESYLENTQVKVKCIGILSTKEKEQVLILPKVYREELAISDHYFTDILDVKLSDYKKYWNHIFNLLNACNKFNFIQMSTLDCYGQNNPKEFLENFSIFIDVINFYKRYGMILQRTNKIHFSDKNVNWNRTITNTDMIIVQNTPIHIAPVGTKKFNSNDNILNKYLFGALDIIDNYIEIKGYKKRNSPSFLNYLIRNALIDLQRIKSKIFSDYHRYCHKMLILFYSGFFCANEEKKNFLIKNFENVYEFMIDNLLREDILSKNINIKNTLKKHKDGRIIDHLFLSKSLFKLNKNTIYVLDSKYYKDDNIDNKSIYKQKIYARNLYDIYLEHEEELNKLDLELVESKFYSYDFIPNYFVIPTLSPKFIDLYDSEKNDTTSKLINNIYFKDHFFDKDTNIIFFIKIDLPKLIDHFIGNNKFELKKFKEFIYLKTSEILKTKYYFSNREFEDTSEMNNYLIENFYLLYGKFIISSNKSIQVYEEKLNQGPSRIKERL